MNAVKSFGNISICVAPFILFIVLISLPGKSYRRTMEEESSTLSRCSNIVKVSSSSLPNTNFGCRNSTTMCINAVKSIEKNLFVLLGVLYLLSLINFPSESYFRTMEEESSTLPRCHPLVYLVTSVTSTLAWNACELASKNNWLHYAYLGYWFISFTTQSSNNMEILTKRCLVWYCIFIEIIKSISYRHPAKRFLV